MSALSQASYLREELDNLSKKIDAEEKKPKDQRDAELLAQWRQEKQAAIDKLPTAGLDDSISSEDSFQGVSTASVLVMPSSGLANSFNGVLVRYASKFYVFSVSHAVVQNIGKGMDDLGLRLLMLDDKMKPTIELRWSRCIHSAAEFLAAPDDKVVDKVINDCSVFVLEGMDSTLNSRALSLFDWQGGAHQPSSKAVGVSIMPEVLDSSSDALGELRIEQRISHWSAGYVALFEAISKTGQSGTGLMDKKRRLVSILSGNFKKDGREVALAVLASRHEALLANAGAESFQSSMRSGASAGDKRKDDDSGERAGGDTKRVNATSYCFVND